MNLKNWIILPFLCFGFVLITWIRPTYAAQLKDIRVGEYETHTRIVFELSGSNGHEKIHTLDSGLLSVLFSDTGLELSRKLPVDRSKRLKEIKIWQRQSGLSLNLQFDFEHYRYERSRMEAPTRIVLDVFPLTSPAPSAKATKSQSNEEVEAEYEHHESMVPPEDSHAAPTPPDEALTATSPETVDRTATPSVEPSKNQTQELPEEEVATQSSPVIEEPIEPKTDTVLPSKTVLQQPAESPRQIKQPDRSQDPSPGRQRMQHYLAVALVVLTLIILILLLVMLVLKNRWTTNNSPAAPREFLEKQDQRIAAIDAKIQEQLKTFDKV